MKKKSGRLNRLSSSMIFLMGVLTLGASILVLGFQNCSPNSKYISSAKSSGNGDGYGGMVTRYFYFDNNHPCSQHDVTGTPLPNGAIFSSDQYRLVRQDCRDQSPQVLNSADFQVAASGELVYQAKSFQPVTPATNLTLVQSGCPTGHSLLPSGVRENLFLDSQELVGGNWYRHAGILPDLSGSLMGVPIYSVTRNDPSLLDQWRRLSQFPDVLNSHSYAFSFLAQPGTDSTARVMVYQTNGLDLQVTIDLLNGSSTIVGQSGTTGIEVQSSIVAGTTRFVTVFFMPTVDPSSPDVGLSPNATNLGASINASDIRLVDTANYCSP